MHTYETKSATFIFNAGLEGELEIVPKFNPGTSVIIAAKDILELVAFEYVLPEKIRQLEKKTVEELLGEDPFTKLCEDAKRSGVNIEELVKNASPKIIGD